MCLLQLVHVGALEVQNVKRAINRYGTLPKGARIGAYLESLRQSGMPSAQESPSSIDLHQQQHQHQQHEAINIIETSQHRSLSPRQNNLRNQPQMTRSNSSSGVVNTYQPPNSPRSRMSSRNKNNNDNIGLRTFRNPNTSTFRTASPSRSVQPTLADLEFPPPPLDLPPPPCDPTIDPPDFSTFSTPADISYSKPSGSPVCMRKSKIDRRSKEEIVEEDDKNNDVRTVEPSVKEASSRFGVNLRRRETTSVTGAGTGTGVTSDSNKTSDEKKNIFRGKECTGKNDNVSGCGILSPPTEAPPPPPPLPPPTSNDTDDGFNLKPGMKEMLELKLINEIKQSADLKQSGTLRKSNVFSNIVSHHLDPASQLLSELCANFNIDQSNKSPIQGEYASLNCLKEDLFHDQSTNNQQINAEKSVSHNKDTKVSSPVTADTLNSGSVGFKLKKVDKKSTSQKEDTIDSQIIDFKARLRKVEKDNIDKQEEKSKKNDDTGADMSEPDDADDKRKSTGSISSLKRLWENKESSWENQPLSPKLSTRGINKQDGGDPGEESPEDHSGASTRSSITSKSDSRISHPANSTTSGGSGSGDNDKPLVPAKPSAAKALGTSGKYFGSSIYATPNCDKHDDDNIGGGGGKQQETKGAKHDVLELSNAIEGSITNLKGTPVIVMASWLQLSDKVGLLHGLLQEVNSAEVAGAPSHARFQFRDLLSRLELQARQLRAAGTRNITENTRLLSDVHNTIKDVTNMIQR